MGRGHPPQRPAATGVRRCGGSRWQAMVTVGHRHRRMPPPHPAAPEQSARPMNYRYHRCRAPPHRPKCDDAAPRGRRGGGWACERAVAYAGGETPTRATGPAPHRRCRCRDCRPTIQMGTPPTGGWMAQTGSATSDVGPATTWARWLPPTKRRQGRRQPVSRLPRRHRRLQQYWFRHRRHRSRGSPPPLCHPLTGLLATAGLKK